MMGKDFDNPFGETTPKGTPKKMSTLLDAALFPGIQGGPHMHSIAGKAVAFGEALEPAFRTYAENVIRNARALAQALIERGYTVLTGGTDNHIVLLDLRNKGLTGRDAETLLEEAGITVNKNLIPYDPQPPLKASGFCLGTPALTTRGFGEEDFRRVAGWIDAVLSHPTDAEMRRRIREEIRAYLEAFPLPYPPTGVVAVG